MCKGVKISITIEVVCIDFINFQESIFKKALTRNSHSNHTFFFLIKLFQYYKQISLCLITCKCKAVLYVCLKYNNENVNCNPLKKNMENKE